MNTTTKKYDKNIVLLPSVFKQFKIPQHRIFDKPKLLYYLSKYAKLYWDAKVLLKAFTYMNDFHNNITTIRYSLVNDKDCKYPYRKENILQFIKIKHHDEYLDTYIHHRSKNNEKKVSFIDRKEFNGLGTQIYVRIKEIKFSQSECYLCTSNIALADKNERIIFDKSTFPIMNYEETPIIVYKNYISIGHPMSINDFAKFVNQKEGKNIFIAERCSGLTIRDR